MRPWVAFSGSCLHWEQIKEGAGNKQMQRSKHVQLFPEVADKEWKVILGGEAITEKFY